MKRRRGNPFTNPWRVMVLLVIGPCTVIVTALLLWFGGYQYLFTSDGIDPQNGRMIVVQPPRIHGAEKITHWCDEYAEAGRKSDPWYRRNCT
ncbi:hypothetical protein [Amycolatopsis sp. CA-230715]|uniref:hypothetical protein n=1 Tax=Amycolatopsis sp. CA-230715 TaxID=2745196 RepID=UPI001C012B17|nr:hypothetical protein [Amycolatopsis sp. CA-230715]QWF79277.1 hypothetical protein HUW46_02684 [Amycolatopsis sp. CA-230715]